jgi:Phosphopantetheine attachment site
MKVSETRDRLIRVIKAVLGVGSLRISGAESLTTDLGMDSLELMSLFALIDSEIGAIDLMPWLVDSSCGGRDTVDGLCRYVAAALGVAEPMGVES